MADLDPSDPIAVIGAFFGVMVAGFMFIIKLMPVLLSGIIPMLFGLALGGFIWFRIFSE